MLFDSIKSLLSHADDNSKIEWVLGFDKDDQSSVDYFLEHTAPEIDQAGGTYYVLGFDPMGYERLHAYVNAMAAGAKGDWFVFWNDDALMQSSGWDSEILSHGDRFCLQAFETHNKHPYSIFPIVPRKWFELMGYLSRHQLNDAWLSQIAWMLDIVVRLRSEVIHNRADLTGNNCDETFRQRRIFEGNINDPRDFNYIKARQQRLNDANKIAIYLTEQGYDMTFWESVKKGTQDPWEKMLASDVNGHMKKFK